MSYKKAVYCQQGHPVAVIERGVFRAEGVAVESTVQGFRVTCSVCGDELRVWKVDVVKAMDDVVALHLAKLKKELLWALGDRKPLYALEQIAPKEYFLVEEENGNVRTAD